MILIGENIHIISKKVREAIENKNLKFLENLLNIQQNLGCIDLNIGPKGSIFEWLVPFVKSIYNGNISFDTTNIDEMETGLKLFGDTENCFINSASKNRFDKMADLALKYNCNLILLTLDKNVPKTADERLEIAFDLYEKCMEKGLSEDKLYFDPLVLPISVDQSQALEAINTLRMIKESLPVKTVIGLSNISNGAVLRPLINRTFASCAYGAGLDAAIIDAKDLELINIFKMLENNSNQNQIDTLYQNISQTVKNFDEISDIVYDVTDEKQKDIMKAAEVILGEKIYSHSFTQI